MANTKITLHPIVNGTQETTTNLYPKTTLEQVDGAQAAIDAKYTKPSGGIPATDLTSAIQTQLTKAESALQKTDVVNNVTTSTVDVPLSANMGKELQDQITNLQSIGRFLSIWNCSTGKPETEPTVTPYDYKTGDYFRVGTISTTTNYKPNGSQYTGTASTTVESSTVKVSYIYYYDGSVWGLQSAGVENFDELTGRPSYNGSAMTSSTNIPEVKTAAWDAKVDSLTDLGVTATATELNYVDGVTSSIQTQLNSKQPSGNYLTTDTVQTVAAAAVKTFNGRVNFLGTGDTNAVYLSTDTRLDVNGTTNTVLGFVNGTFTINHTNYGLNLRGSNTRPNYNGNQIALYSDIPTTYAGSSSAGGAATSANKLNTDAGSATQPIYFANGIPVASTYELNKTVPADAKFTDTTYSEATTSVAGLMSASDKVALNSAIQPNDNVSELNNDAGYLTASTAPTELFWCTYGTTTYAEVTAALASNKLPVMSYQNNFYICMTLVSSTYYFSAMQLAYHHYISLSSSGWGSKTSRQLENASNRVSSIGSYSTSTTNYPNTKAVYDYANTAVTNSHTHSNKALLDTYTQTEANLASAVTNNHMHSNKALLDTYTQTEVNLASAVTNTHTHNNKATLDTISASDQVRKITVSTSDPSGGSDGDIWLKYDV